MTDPVLYRPILSVDPCRPPGARQVAGGMAWTHRAEVLSQGHPPRAVPLEAVPGPWRTAWESPRPDVAGLPLSRPRVMGILNVTPDSFSDGGRTLAQSLAKARDMAKSADILDIGGESTRPGAEDVRLDEELARVLPLITALRAEGVTTPISVDTRKARVAEAALAAGANIINDVSGLAHDPDMARVVAETGCPVIVMHMRGTPKNMLTLTEYDDVVRDVYRALERAVDTAFSAGICQSQMIIDPGIGFAKTAPQSLAILQRISLFHGLGTALCLGVSRKRFIDTYGQAPVAADRDPGTLAVVTNSLTQGVQIIRVHDTKGTSQALKLTVAQITGG